MAMDWDKLRIFYAVSEAGSFTHAGERLNLSQSAISRQISTLEDSLGISLFHRHARGLVLTEEGELLHNTVQDIFGKLSMIEGQLTDSHQRAEGPLTITVAEFIGSTWLAPKLAQLHQENRDIQITIILDDRLLNLGMREADAAIRLYKPEQSDLIQKHLTTIKFRACASTTYLKENDTPQSLKDLDSHTIIGYPANTPAPFSNPNWLFQKAKINMADNSRVILINSISGILEAVQSHAGIACLPDYLIESHPDIKTVLPDESHEVDMYFVYPEERRHSGRIQILRDFLTETIEKAGL